MQIVDDLDRGEIIETILTFLDLKSLVRLTSTCKFFAFPSQGRQLAPTEFAARENSRKIFLGWELHLLEFGRNWKWLLHLAENPTRAALVDACKTIDTFVQVLNEEEKLVAKGRAQLAIANLKIKTVLSEQTQSETSAVVASEGVNAAKIAVDIFESLGDDHIEEYCASLLRLGTLSSFNFDHMRMPSKKREALIFARNVVEKAGIVIREATDRRSMKAISRAEKMTWALMEAHYKIVQGQFEYAQDHFDEAIKIYIGATSLLTTLLGEDHLLTAEVLQKLGRSYEMGCRHVYDQSVRKNYLENAKVCYTKSKASRLARLGEQHPDTVMVQRDLDDSINALRGNYVVVPQ